jgi:hypothetical protein
VGEFISQAMNTLVEKINSKEKVAAANKAMIRILD